MGESFERFEYKYVITQEQYLSILHEIQEHFAVDKYGETTIQSLYFDTDTYRLIRRSIEQPFYKEKMRLRSYGLSTESNKVFLELKKKYDGIVYKRRISIFENQVNNLFSNVSQNSSQIEKEMIYFSKIYPNLQPKALILYDRIAMFGKDNDLRLTFDRQARFRLQDLNLHTNLTGIPIFHNGEIIMEIKANSPYPLWLCNLLNKNCIYKSSFSKYGFVYQNYIFHKEQITC